MLDKLEAMEHAAETEADADDDLAEEAVPASPPHSVRPTRLVHPSALANTPSLEGDWPLAWWFSVPAENKVFVIVKKPPGVVVSVKAAGGQYVVIDAQVQLTEDDINLIHAKTNEQIERFVLVAHDTKKCSHTLDVQQSVLGGTLLCDDKLVIIEFNTIPPTTPVNFVCK